jgi:hypothetical protein
VIVLSKVEIPRLKETEHLTKMLHLSRSAVTKTRLRLAVCSERMKDKDALQLLREMEFISRDRALMREGIFRITQTRDLALHECLNAIKLAMECKQLSAEQSKTSSC